MCAIDDGEPSDVWCVTHPRARKRWTCIECHRVIQPGETYQRVGSLYDGQWHTLITCRHCEAAGRWLDYVCGGYPAHCLDEELREHFWEGYGSILLGRLILGVRDRWHDGTDPVPDTERVRAVADWSMARRMVGAR